MLDEIAVMLDEIKLFAILVCTVCGMVATIVVTVVIGDATKATACIQQQMEWVDNNCTRPEGL